MVGVVDAARHVRELEPEHFVVVVDAHDEASKTRAREALSAHGGHFINFYSRWSTEDLTPSVECVSHPCRS